MKKRTKWSPHEASRAKECDVSKQAKVGMSAINVLHIIDNLQLGGAQTLLLDLLRLLDRKKYSTVVCCLRQPTPLSQEAEAGGLSIVYLNRRRYDPRQFYDLIRLIRRNKIQLVHTHLFASGIIGRVAAIICRVPIIVLHDHTGVVLLDRTLPVLIYPLVLANNALARFTDKVIVVSQSMTEHWVTKKKVDKQKVVVIHNGIDLHKFSPERFDSTESKEKLGIEPSATLVGTVGRLASYKGHKYFLEAVAEVSPRFPQAKFIIVGDGPLRAELADKSRFIGIDDRVIFTGFRRDILQLLIAMDVFVLPSLSETLGIAILEAMAMGKPVVATSVGGIPDVVVPNVTGLLVPPGDWQALAAAIVELLEDPGKRKALGENGRRRVGELFNREATVGKIEMIYDELLSSKIRSRKS